MNLSSHQMINFETCQNEIVKKLCENAWTRTNVESNAVSEHWDSFSDGFVLFLFSAPPTFIDSIQPYSGTLYSSKKVSLTCRVECSPLCRIIWQKNGVTLDDSDIYHIHSHVLPEDPMTNDFQSIVSTLTWNMSNWPSGQLDRLHDNANYSCHSTGNNIGIGVSSSTYFKVECKHLEST